MVLRRCRQLLRDEQEAVEAMQDTFVQLLRRRERMEVTAPSSLLYRTATNVCLNRIRYSRRHPSTPDDELIARIAAAPEAEGLGIARVLLERIFAQEQPSTREIAVMVWVDGMTYQEVAEAVGLSVSGVRKRLRTLQAHVEDHLAAAG
ncbi:MAG: sigma-70 family RNA polymerase sigma factor [Alphaproteobacteria bacterium]|nr:sigma-70 family RNA polymerase sigma factor [Alphaproteobacteria bacterium]